MIFGFLVIVAGFSICYGIYRVQVEEDDARRVVVTQTDLEAATAQLLEQDAAHREGLRNYFHGEFRTGATR